jgi:hypothetical protein
MSFSSDINGQLYSIYDNLPVNKPLEEKKEEINDFAKLFYGKQTSVRNFKRRDHTHGTSENVE